MGGVGGRRLGSRTAERIRGRLFDEAGCVVDVYVLDRSSSGVRLEAPFGLALPRRFRLQFKGGKHLAEIIWRRGYELGARFVTEDEVDAAPPRPKPVTIKKTSLAELRRLIRR
jgi:hypothetical protein